MTTRLKGLWAKATQGLSEAAWLDGQRLRAYGLIFIIVAALALGYWLVHAPHLIDLKGRPLGPDFMSFYAAARLSLGGHPALVWDPVAHQAAEDGIFGHSLGYWGFFYPPAYLLLLTPLGALGYGPALLVFSAIGIGLWLSSAQAVLRSSAIDLEARRTGLLLLAAYPVLWLNLFNGQNAALLSGLFLLGFVCLRRSELLGGLILGGLMIKPQMALAVPIVLLLAGRFKALGMMGFSAFCLYGIAYLILGPEAYLAFFKASHLATETLSQGLVEPYKMQSLYSALRLLGLGSDLSLWAHSAFALLLIALSAHGLKLSQKETKAPEALALGALASALTLGLSPFLLDYDWLISGVALVWLVLKGLELGFRPYEKLSLLGLCLWPLLARTLGQSLHLGLSPLMALGLLTLVLTRLSPNALKLKAIEWFRLDKSKAS